MEEGEEMREVNNGIHLSTCTQDRQPKYRLIHYDRM